MKSIATTVCIFSLAVLPFLVSCASDSLENVNDDKSDLGYEYFDCVWGPPIIMQGKATQYTIYSHHIVDDAYLGKEENEEAQTDNVTQREISDVFQSLEKVSTFLDPWVTLPEKAEIFICPGSGEATVDRADIDPGRRVSRKYRNAIALHEYTHLVLHHNAILEGVAEEGWQKAELFELLADFSAVAILNDPSYMAGALREHMTNTLREQHVFSDTLTEAEIQEEVKRKTASRDFGNPDAPIEKGRGARPDPHTILGPVVSEIGRIWAGCRREGVDVRGEIMKALVDIELSVARGGPNLISNAKQADPSLVQWNQAIMTRLRSEIAWGNCTLF